MENTLRECHLNQMGSRLMPTSFQRGRDRKSKLHDTSDGTKVSRNFADSSKVVYNGHVIQVTSINITGDRQELIQN